MRPLSSLHFFSISYNFHSNQFNAIARGFWPKTTLLYLNFCLFIPSSDSFTAICSFVGFHMTEWPCTTMKVNSKLRWPAPVCSAVSWEYFWRLHNNYYTLLVNITLAIINLQTWCSKWQISLNMSKTNYMVFYYDKKSYHHHQIYQYLLTKNHSVKSKKKDY